MLIISDNVVGESNDKNGMGKDILSAYLSCLSSLWKVRSTTQSESFWADDQEMIKSDVICVYIYVALRHHEMQEAIRVRWVNDFEI